MVMVHHASQEHLHLLQTLEDEEGGTEKVVVADDSDHGVLVVALVALLLLKKTLHSSSSKTLEASTFPTEPRLSLSGVASLDPFHCSSGSWNMLICLLLPHGACCADQRPFLKKTQCNRKKRCVFDINKCFWLYGRFRIMR